MKISLRFRYYKNILAKIKLFVDIINFYNKNSFIISTTLYKICKSLINFKNLKPYCSSISFIIYRSK
jgi:hypothetical protein